MDRRVEELEKQVQILQEMYIRDIGKLEDRIKELERGIEVVVSTEKEKSLRHV